MTKTFRLLAVNAIIALASAGSLQAAQETETPAAGVQQMSQARLDSLFAGTKVIVLPFRDLSGVADTAWIGSGIAQTITADLPSGVTVVPISQESDILVSMGTDGTDLAARHGARWVVHGSYQLLGPRIRITAHVLDSKTGLAILSTKLDGSLDELFEIQDRILPALGVTTEAPRPVAPTPSQSLDRPLLTAASLSTDTAIVPPPPILPATQARDSTGQTTVRAVRLTTALNMDGKLDEPFYQLIEPISDFVQYEPTPGISPTEKTEVWLFFDDTHIYITARCWHSGPESEWIANEMRRDSLNLLNNEHVGIVLDTFHDRRNGILFNITPLGGRMDGQITNEGNWNGDWNPIWDVRTGRFDGGWTLEAEIPFKSLRYHPGGPQTWGIQLRRNLQSLNEIAYLTPLDRGLGGSAIFHVSQAATLVGIEVPTSGRLFEVKPYAIGTFNSQGYLSNSLTTELSGNGGLDLIKYGLTDNLTADLTFNTDFAQVEADEQQVNLTRFSLFFPEKREFFLENQGVFAFGGSGRGSFGSASETPIMFYSRQIGLNEGRAVPITAGGRLTGRMGPFTLGLLNIQTGDQPVSGSSGTNFTVARIKRDVLRRSSIGAIVTSRTALSASSGSNQAIGLDATLAFYDNLAINNYWAKTNTTGLQGNDTSYRSEFRYDGDRYGAAAEHLFIDERFSPGVGFLRRPDLRKNFGSLRFSPRPNSIDWIRRFSWEGSYNFITDAGGTVETREAIGNFQVELENSDGFDLLFTDSYDLLQRPFNIASNVTIPVGGYQFSNTAASYRFGPQRRLAGNVSFEHGSFYGGTKSAVTIGGGFGRGGGRIELSPQFALEPGLSINQVKLPQGNFTTQLITTRSTYTFTPTMFISALVQYNSSNSAVSSNVRLRWEYQPGSELFVVYNDQRDTLMPGRLSEFQTRTFIIKFNRLFRL